MANEAHGSQKWLLVFLIYADFTIKDSPTDPKIVIKGDIKLGLNRLFEDLINTRIDPNRCRLCIVMNRITYLQDSERTEFRKREQVVIIEMGPDPKHPAKNKIKKISPFTSGSFDVENNKYVPHSNSMQKSRQLGKMLGRIKIDPQEKVLLATWDHGSVFGIFKVESDDHDIIAPARSRGDTGKRNKEQELAQNVETYKFQIKLLPYLNVFWEAIEKKKNPELKWDPGSKFKDQQTYLQRGSRVWPSKNRRTEDGAENSNQVNEILSTNELAEAIRIWLKKSGRSTDDKIDVLLMMNCYMLNMHTMHNVQKEAHCLVGSGTVISNPCYHYRSIIKEVNRDRGKPLTARRLARHCVYSAVTNSSRNRAREMHLDPRTTIDNWALFAVDLDCAFEENSTRSVNSGEPGEQGENQKLPVKVTRFQRQLKLLLEILSAFNKILNPDVPPGLPPHKKEKIQKKTVLFKTMFKYSRMFMKDLSEKYEIVDISNWFELLMGLDVSDSSNELIDPDLENLMREFVKNTKREKKQINAILTNLPKKFRYGNSSNGTVSPSPTGFGLFFPWSDEGFKDNNTISSYTKTDALLQESLNKWKLIVRQVYDTK